MNYCGMEDDSALYDHQKFTKYCISKALDSSENLVSSEDDVISSPRQNDSVIISHVGDTKSALPATALEMKAFFKTFDDQII